MRYSRPRISRAVRVRLVAAVPLALLIILLASSIAFAQSYVYTLTLDSSGTATITMPGQENTVQLYLINVTAYVPYIPGKYPYNYVPETVILNIAGYRVGTQRIGLENGYYVFQGCIKLQLVAGDTYYVKAVARYRIPTLIVNGQVWRYYYEYAPCTEIKVNITPIQVLEAPRGCEFIYGQVMTEVPVNISGSIYDEFVADIMGGPYVAKAIYRYSVDGPPNFIGIAVYEVPSGKLVHYVPASALGLNDVFTTYGVAVLPGKHFVVWGIDTQWTTASVTVDGKRLPGLLEVLQPYREGILAVMWTDNTWSGDAKLIYITPSNLDGKVIVDLPDDSSSNDWWPAIAPLHGDLVAVPHIKSTSTGYAAIETLIIDVNRRQIVARIPGWAILCVARVKDYYIGIAINKTDGSWLYPRPQYIVKISNDFKKVKAVCKLTSASGAAILAFALWTPKFVYKFGDYIVFRDTSISYGGAVVVVVSKDLSFIRTLISEHWSLGFIGHFPVLNNRALIVGIHESIIWFPAGSGACIGYKCIEYYVLLPNGTITTVRDPFAEEYVFEHRKTCEEVMFLGKWWIYSAASYPNPYNFMVRADCCGGASENKYEVYAITDKGTLDSQHLYVARELFGVMYVDPNTGELKVLKLPSPIELDFIASSLLLVTLPNEQCTIVCNSSFIELVEASRRKVVFNVYGARGELSRVIMWLPAVPRRVLANGRQLKYDPELRGYDVWRYDPASNLLECIVMHHSPVTIEVELNSGEVSAIKVYKVTLYPNTVILTLQSDERATATVYINGRRFALQLTSGLATYRLPLYGLDPPYRVSVLDSQGNVVYYAVLEPHSRPVAAAMSQPPVSGATSELFNLAVLLVAVVALLCIAAAWYRRQV